jgi:hypothetical protein
MLQLGKVIAKALAGGAPDAISRDLGDALASHPDSAAEVVRLLFAESRKKRANDQLIHAFSIMLESALEAARWREENGSASANNLIATVRTAVRNEVEGREVDPKALFAIVHSFSSAKVDPGAYVNRAIEASVSSGPGMSSVDALSQTEAAFRALAEDLDHNCFLIHEQIRDLISSAPVEPRMELIASIAASPTPSLRESVAGFLVDSDPSVGNAVAGILAQGASKGLVSGATVDRLVMMRNWVGMDRRSAIDAAIRAARQKGISAAARAAVQTSEIIVSACDGAGAQSWFVVLRQRRKFAIAALLTKHGFGLRDAWVRSGLTAAEAKDFLAQIEVEMCNFSSSLGNVATAVEHGLAVALERGETIPFGLVQFIEDTGLGSCTPAQHSPDALLEQLIAELPAGKSDDAAVSRSLARSKHWGKSLEWLDLWFEDSDAALVAVNRGANKKDKVANVLRDVLERRRRYWGELLAWTAFGASDDDAVDDLTGLLLVARELFGARPLMEIPLAVLIARNTVEAMGGGR